MIYNNKIKPNQLIGAIAFVLVRCEGSYLHFVTFVFGGGLEGKNKITEPCRFPADLQSLHHYTKLTIIDLRKTHAKCHPREKDCKKEDKF